MMVITDGNLMMVENGAESNVQWIGFVGKSYVGKHIEHCVGAEECFPRLTDFPNKTNSLIPFHGATYWYQMNSPISDRYLYTYIYIYI